VTYKGQGRDPNIPLSQKWFEIHARSVMTLRDPEVQGHADVIGYDRIRYDRRD